MNRILYLACVWLMGVPSLLAHEPGLRYTLSEQGRKFKSLAFSPDGKVLVASCEDAIKLWNVATGKLVGELRTDEDVAHPGCLAFSPDGATLASTHNTGIILWDVSTRKVKGSIEDFFLAKGPIAFSPDGKTLATLHRSCGKIVQLFDLAAKKTTAECCLAGDGGGPMAFSSDVNAVAWAANDFGPVYWRKLQTEKPWDLLSSKNSITLSGRNGWISSLQFSRDGKTLVEASHENSVTFWDLTTGKTRGTLDRNAGRVECIAFSPNDKTLASGDTDGTLNLWDVATGRNTATVGGHAGSIHVVVFSPDGTILASAGQDKAIKVWDSEASQEIKKLRIERQRIAAKFSLH